MCITPGELAWSVNIDIHVLDHDGNLMDACALAAIAALSCAKIPKYDKEQQRVIRDFPKEDLEDLPVVDKPIAITIYKISNRLLIDTNLEEENAIDARITITTNSEGNLCAMQKGGNGYFTIEELEKAADISIQKGKEIRALL